MKFNSKIYIALLSGSILFASCGKKENASTKEAAVETPALGANQIEFSQEQYMLADLQAGKVEKRNLSELIKLNGKVSVKPQSTASVAVPFGGYLKSAALIVGQQVKKGERIAQLENPTFIQMQQEYLESKSSLKFLKKEYERQANLRKDEINSAKTFQKTTADFESMKAKVQALRKQLRMAGVPLKALDQGKISSVAYVYAPISGTITYAEASRGEFIESAKMLYRIENKSDVYLTLSAFENNMQEVKVGQRVKFSTTKENNFQRNAEVIYKGISADENQDIMVTCKIDDADVNGLLSGMYVKAWVEKGLSLQDAVPSDAIMQLAGKDYLVVQQTKSNSYVFTLVEIRKGKTQEGLTVVNLPKSFDRNSVIVVKNAYTVLAAIRNLSEGDE